MKKVKIIVGAILRGTLIIAPGAAFAWWAWNKAMALIAILAAVGVETLFLVAFTFITVAVETARKVKQPESDESEMPDVNI